jgi:cytosine/adenosine deaminase-related metal-dependent hydrolase
VHDHPIVFRVRSSGAAAALHAQLRHSAWFSGEEKEKGTLEPGRYADLAVLSADYLSVPEERIGSLESVLTVAVGKVVFGAGEFASLGPAPIPVEPAWSPVARFGGYAAGGLR